MFSEGIENLPHIGWRLRDHSASLAKRQTLHVLAFAGIEPSVGSVGDSYKNALAETINGLYKTEIFQRQGPRRNMQDLEMATLGWVDWFNQRRLLGSIGNIPPTEVEENFYAQRDVLDMVA